MAYTPEQRRLLQTKQRRIKVRDGAPAIGDLNEGVPSIRSTSGGLYQYIRHNNVLYRVKLDRV